MVSRILWFTGYFPCMVSRTLWFTGYFPRYVTNLVGFLFLFFCKWSNPFPSRVFLSRESLQAMLALVDNYRTGPLIGIMFSFQPGLITRWDVWGEIVFSFRPKAVCSRFILFHTAVIADSRQGACSAAFRRQTAWYSDAVLLPHPLGLTLLAPILHPTRSSSLLYTVSQPCNARSALFVRYRLGFPGIN